MRKTFLLIVSQIILAQVLFGQSLVTVKDKVISIPKEIGVVSLILQPDCPLRIENAELLIDEDGKNPMVKYTLKIHLPKQFVIFQFSFTENSP